MTITTAQIRGARGILGWSQQDLTDRTDISTTSIGSIEKGATKARASTLKIIRAAFEGAGIEFIDGGIRTKTAQVDTLKGIDGFHRYSYDLYETMQKDDREVLQAHIDDIRFANWLGEEAYPHVKRMQSLKSKRLKIIQKEGDDYFPAKKYAEYRWIPKNQFSTVPFVVYGDNLALTLFEPEPMIIIIRQSIVAQAYRNQFQFIWEASITPPQGLVDQSIIPEKYIEE